MATQARKRALYTRLQKVLGDEHAETLMTHLPREPGTQLATKSNLDDRFDRLEKTLTLRFTAVEARLDRVEGRFDTMDHRVCGLQDLFRDQLKTYTITMVGAMSALTAIYGALLTVIT